MVMHGGVIHRSVGPNHSEDPRHVFHMREDIYCRAAEAQITRLALGFGALLAEDGSVPARITAAIAQAAEAPAMPAPITAMS